ncbi:MAG: CRISPR-associated endonuclease Cas3'' [Aestuariivita sp.]|nr:CRISPR-associated endonuclease Cas3'' [Aestuariivita sp.]
MREVIAICRSEKRSRNRVARVLDRYFWRIGDRTWRGKATNACLDRVSRELRTRATRNTAVVIHEIRSAHESRIPIVRIGSKNAFSPEGFVPIASHPAEFQRLQITDSIEKSAAAIVSLAALFHDLGKATNLFQEKINLAIAGAEREPDAIRHELYSAAVWDHLFGQLTDEALSDSLKELTAEKVDEACLHVSDAIGDLPSDTKKRLPFNFLNHECRHAHWIGMLILTHHRLPEGDSDLLKPLALYHSRSSGSFLPKRDLKIANGRPFWHENWWIKRIAREADALLPQHPVPNVDISLRAALMLADHLGSSEKELSLEKPEHLANSITKESVKHPADSLSTHVKRVYANVRHTVALFQRYADRFPALDEEQMPTDIAFPRLSPDKRFYWQLEATHAARELCKNSEGGFFGCLLAGTGTGKTRGAPTILAAASFADTSSEKRYFRISLCLGLRVLATQSAKEYTTELGFHSHNISVLVGKTPVEFDDNKSEKSMESNDFAMSFDIPDWLRVELATGGVPPEGDERELDWLQSLSLDTGRNLPAFLEKIFETTQKERADVGRRMLQLPILVGTVDHLMGISAPLNSGFLLPAIRVATSDLILDEIDNFDGEDIAAIGRLIYQAGSFGRRVIIMSATLTSDIADTLYMAYCRGWSAYARANRLRDHVNLLISGDAVGSCVTNKDGGTIRQVIDISCKKTIKALKASEPLRRAEILDPCNEWKQFIDQVSDNCSRLHDLNSVEINGFRVSFGMVRLTHIRHTAALALQLPSGKIKEHLRVKLCLHSQFPRLNREYIQERLKNALTRSGENPNQKLEILCNEEKLFERARSLDVREIEIVLITSPVIETGNDLDFDWAILDPISTRSIIQSSGRVNRHRVSPVSDPNILILGKSLVPMETGRLSMPGVETKPHPDTNVTWQDLSYFGERFFKDLVGNMDMSVIDATPLLSSEGTFPLRDAERENRWKMIQAQKDCAEMPLGRYIRRLNGRFNRRMFSKRKFRRKTKQSIIYKLEGEDFRMSSWYVNLSPFDCKNGFKLADVQDKSDDIQEEILFKKISERSWQKIFNSQSFDLKNLGLLMRVEISIDKNEVEPQMVYTEFTGFTRGSFGDLLCPFGKNLKNQ